MKNDCCTILQASDATSQTGKTIDSNQLVSASFHVYFGDSSAAGTLNIQASNDPTQQGSLAFVPTHWINIPSASATITAGGAQIITITGLCYRWIRAVYTETTPGTSTITVNMNAYSP